MDVVVIDIELLYTYVLIKIGPTGVGKTELVCRVKQEQKALFCNLFLYVCCGVLITVAWLCFSFLKAKQISDFLFHDSNAMTRIDMSEYMEKFSVRYIGDLFALIILYRIVH